MALKVGEGLTAGSSRLTITIKASVETQWCTLQTDVTSANGGGGRRGDGWRASFALPEFKSKIAAPFAPSSKVHCLARSGVQVCAV